MYQDLFGEGSFTGKGIYDVDAFEQALSHRLPDNRILSHDLLEGCYARAGLPATWRCSRISRQSYRADIRRRHRWIRGDWQIAQWMLPRVPLADGGTEENPLSALSRWKVFDNLRRSLAVPAQFLLFVLGWLLLPGAVAWTIGVALLTYAPVPVEVLFAALRKPSDARWRAHLKYVAASNRQAPKSMPVRARLPAIRGSDHARRDSSHACGAGMCRADTCWNGRRRAWWNAAAATVSPTTGAAWRSLR